MTTTDYPDWATSQDQASAISTTGVPLLRNELAVTSGTTAALAAGASANASGGPFPLLAPSYDLTVTLTAAAVGVQLDGVVTLKWRDSTNTTLLAQKAFGIVASGGGHAVTITGPVRGAKLSITFTNSSISSQTITFSYTLVSSARVAANDLCRTITGIGANPPSEVTWAGASNMDSGILGNASPSIATGVAALRGLLMYNGPVSLNVVAGSGLADAEVALTILDTTLAVNVQDVFHAFTNANGYINANFIMPMCQCKITMINHNAATHNISFMLATQETNVN